MARVLTAAAASLAAALLAAVPTDARKGHPRPPPMGWMSWQVFRCEVDCTTYPNDCINAALYEQQADAMVSGGFVAAGYNGIHIDDCWMQDRDPSSGQLVANTTRFPQGLAGVASYVHGKGMQFAAYTAEYYTTCAGYPASRGKESIDANTFAGWGMDYVKVDGCGDVSYYPTGYPTMGNALIATGRDIQYSCSWPAYLGDNETAKPYQLFVDAGCDLWRNWDDVQPSWSSLVSIIDHYGDYSVFLQKWSGPEYHHDPDMLLVGVPTITDDEARTQMALWSIMGAPLIMGNDVRNITQSCAAILLNPEAIAIDQDPIGIMGLRLTPQNATEIWARNLSDGSIAVGLFNKLGGSPPPAPGPCNQWNQTVNGYLEACGGSGGDIECFTGVALADAEAYCCGNPYCAGFSYAPSGQSGCYKRNTDCGFVSAPGYDGYYKPSFTPPPPTPADITLPFSMLGLPSNAKVNVRDVWARQDLGAFTNSYTAKAVPFHGTAFLRVSLA